MSHPLDGCFTKLERAGHHLVSFQQAALQLQGTNPDPILVEFDPERGQDVFRAQGDMSAPPLEWSGIVGDVVHNLRAALDYLIWELTPPADRAGRERDIAFPVSFDAKAFEDKERKRITPIDPAAQEVIRCLQPFREDGLRVHRWEHPLARLHLLDRWDKHRSLNLTTITVRGELTAPGSQIRTPPGPRRLYRGPYKRGTVLAVLPPPPGQLPTGQIAATHQLILDLEGSSGSLGARLSRDDREVLESLREREVIPLLETLLLWVRGEAVEKLCPFFPKRE